MNQQTIDSFIQEYNDFRSAFQKRAQEKFKEVFKEFWEENPGINVVTWTQYAPYFNDGEPCVFGINCPTFSNATEPDDISDLRWEEYNGETEGIWGCGEWNIKDIAKEYPGVNPESTKILASLINSDPMEDVLEDMFGSDNRVVATREGFTSEDYCGEHD